MHIEASHDKRLATDGCSDEAVFIDRGRAFVVGGEESEIGHVTCRAIGVSSQGDELLLVPFALDNGSGRENFEFDDAGCFVGIANRTIGQPLADEFIVTCFPVPSACPLYGSQLRKLFQAADCRRGWRG